ncbi:MAG: hypothetical protein Q9160_005434 [Pyrenula sp. 1 TL-2023]
MYHYGQHPPNGWTPYYDSSSPTSPYNSDSNQYTYYAPQFGATPKRHSRKYSSSGTKAAWHSPAGYPGPQFYEAVPDYKSPPKKHDDYVSVKHNGRTYKIRASSFHTPQRPQKQPIFVDAVDDAYDSPQYIYREPEPKKAKKSSKAYADHHYQSQQEPRYEDSPKRSRARRSSTNTRSPPKPKTKSYARSPQATEEDAIRAGIPSGYSIKNWDPTESPIVLLGSVFDANSLGKWIYDWTVYHHGASTPMADVAGDLWLLLIKLAGKMKRAEECVPRIRSVDSREMVEDFLESGARLWVKFKSLLKDCEKFMWRAAKREGGKGLSMGKNAGCEFVESIFGRDRELEHTERLMNNVRLWNMRFDANCEEILRRPSAA